MIEKTISDLNQEEIIEIEESEEKTDENKGMQIVDIQEVKPMNIYQKLTYIQNDLLEIPIPKNGKNPFGNFTYYELEDLLPPILKLCKKYGCTLYFNFPSVEGTCYKGVLNLISWEDKTDCIKVEVPFPQLEKLPKMNYAQVSGTYQTYMKRYLILHTFDIVEKEVIDSGVMQNQTGKTNKSSVKATSTPKSSNKGSKTVSKNNSVSSKKQEKENTESIAKPDCLQKVIDRCHELHSEKECDGKLLNRVSLKMFNDKEITLEERKQIFNYIKTLK